MNHYPQKQQSGVVLVISLIILLLLTILGVTAMQVNGLEEKMAGNSRDQNIAFQAAESALVEAEKFILNNPTDEVITYNGDNGLLGMSNDEPTNYFDLAVWGESQIGTNPNTNSFELAEPPQYIIKKISLILPGTPGGETKTYFKITARAVGRSAGTQVILQEYFVHKIKI